MASGQGDQSDQGDLSDKSDDGDRSDKGQAAPAASESPEGSEESTAATASHGGGGGGGRWAWLRGRGARRTGGIVWLIVLATAGAVVGILVGGQTTSAIGPITTQLSVTPFGSTAELAVPPVAAIDLDAYDGPLGLRAEVIGVDGVQAMELAKDKSKLQELEHNVTGEIEDAVIWLAIKTALFAMGGAALFALLAYRQWRKPLIAAGISLALLAGCVGLGAATFRQKALTDFTVTGALSQTPTLLSGLEAKFTSYRKGMSKMVHNISRLYTTTAALPSDPANNSVRLLHVSDFHLNPEGFDLLTQLVQQFHVQAVLDTGDLVDWGSAPEAKTFKDPISKLGVPYIYIKGNHDSPETVKQAAALPNTTVLNKSTTTVGGIEIAGIGDPRFSPDKSSGSGEQPKVVKQNGKDLAGYVDTLKQPPAIAMIHDPIGAPALAGKAPIVLSGHTHERAIKDLGDGTTLMVEGSTGGAGLRGVEKDEPTPLTATVLYFDPETKQLRAYDEVTVGGLGEEQVSIQRHTVPPGGQPAEEGAVDSTPAPNGTTAPEGDSGGGSGGEEPADPADQEPADQDTGDGEPAN